LKTPQELVKAVTSASSQTQKGFIALNIDVVGHTAEEKALVNQWMEYRITKIDPCENDVRSMQGVLKVIAVPDLVFPD